MLIAYLMTIIISYLVFREVVRNYGSIFEDMDIKDLVVIFNLLLIPVLNMVVTFLLLRMLKKQSGNFVDLLKKAFLTR